MGSKTSCVHLFIVLAFASCKYIAYFKKKVRSSLVAQQAGSGVINAVTEVTAMAQVPSLVQERPHAAGVPPPPKEKNALSWQVDVGGINPG